MLFKQFITIKHSLYVVECGIRFLAKKYMDLIKSIIISQFFYSSACLAAPAHCISMEFCCSTCLAILTVIDESWCHLDPLCCFMWRGSSQQFPLSSTHLLHLEVGFLISYKEYKTCQLYDLHTEPKDKLSPKLSCSLLFSCNISSSVVQIIY